MPTFTFTAKDATPTGDDGTSAGTLRVTPMRLVKDGFVRTGKEFSVPLVDGAADVALDVTAPGEAYKIVENVTGGNGGGYWVVVKEGDTTWADLEVVSQPGTSLPTPIWEANLVGLRSRVDVVEEAAGEAVVAVEVLAGDVAGKATPADVAAAVNGLASESYVGQQVAPVAAAVKGLPPSPLINVTVTALSSTPRPFDQFGGKLYGTTTGKIWKSSDEGRTWQDAGTPPTGYLTQMIPTFDGEVVLTTETSVYRSTGWASGNPTWTLKATANGVCQFQAWSLSGNGTKFITTEYAAGADFAASRYARISLDGGVTWNVAYDSVAKHGQTAADGSHLHGCAYDPWSDRFYISEGHSNTGDIGGLWCSTDNGATWNRAEGMKSNPSPSVVIATDDGLVCSSDNANGGTYGVVRATDPSTEQLVRTWAWRPGDTGVLGFGVHGYRDPDTGIVYFGYRCEKVDIAPMIIGGTPTSGALVYAWPTLPVIAYDDIRRVFVTSRNHLLALAFVNGVNSLVRGQLGAPGAAAATLVDTGSTLGGAASQGSSVAVGPRAGTGAGIRNVAVGVTATASATQDSTAVGFGASATFAAVVSVGSGSIASHPNQTLVGYQAAGTGANGTAVGYQSSASSSAVAIGYQAVAPTSSVVIGGGASVAIGSTTTVVGAASSGRNAGTSIGQGSTHSGNNATTLGQGTTANADATALGQGAAAGQTGAVALGKGTVTTLAQQVAIGARHLEIGNVTDPGAPAAGKARIFTRLNGSSKTEVCVRFPTGSVVVIATEP